SGALITAAITADGTSGGKQDSADYAGAAQYVNWYNVMTYDFFGAWAATGPTAPHSPLTSWSTIPTPGFYTDNAVQHLKSKGVSASFFRELSGDLWNGSSVAGMKSGLG